MINTRDKILHAVEVVLWAELVAFAAVIATADLPSTGLGWRRLLLGALAAALVAGRKALAGELVPKALHTVATLAELGTGIETDGFQPGEARHT